ncbi:hypothetical protein CN946_15385 [Bacillus sp. AFS053548]|nr:hypothetical protein CN946_15385 [Bacillus sp. AFS053548]
MHLRVPLEEKVEKILVWCGKVFLSIYSGKMIKEYKRNFQTFYGVFSLRKKNVNFNSGMLALKYKKKI